MFLISMDGYKALDMADIKGYFIYQGGNFPKDDEHSAAPYELFANTRWHNQRFGDCNQYKIGTYETLDAAKKIMHILTSEINPYASGRIFVFRDTVEFEK